MLSSVDVRKPFPRRTLIGDPNKCIINVRKPKLINIHKRIIFKVIAFMPPQIARPKTPQPAINTIHVLSNAIFVLPHRRNPGVWGESCFRSQPSPVRKNSNMAVVRSILRTGLFRNSIVQASGCLSLRGLSTHVHVDDYVTGITEEQKQVQCRCCIK